MMFFTGLHSLLTVVAQRRVLLAATRVESVKARLHVMGGAIRQWVEHGRAQRAAIDDLLLPATRNQRARMRVSRENWREKRDGARWSEDGSVRNFEPRPSAFGLRTAPVEHVSQVDDRLVQRVEQVVI